VGQSGVGDIAESFVHQAVAFRLQRGRVVDSVILCRAVKKQAAVDRGLAAKGLLPEIRIIGQGKLPGGQHSRGVISGHPDIEIGFNVRKDPSDIVRYTGCFQWVNIVRGIGDPPVDKHDVALDTGGDENHSLAHFDTEPVDACALENGTVDIGEKRNHVLVADNQRNPEKSSRDSASSLVPEARPSRHSAS